MKVRCIRILITPRPEPRGGPQGPPDDGERHTLHAGQDTRVSSAPTASLAPSPIDDVPPWASWSCLHAQSPGSLLGHSCHPGGVIDTCSRTFSIFTLQVGAAPLWALPTLLRTPACVVPHKGNRGTEKCMTPLRP